MLAIFSFRGLRRRIDLSVPKVKYQLYVFWNFRMMERERNEMKTRAPFVRPSYSADTYTANSRTSSRSLRTAVISNIRKQLGAPGREYALSLAIYPFRSAPRASNSADVNFFLSPSPPPPRCRSALGGRDSICKGYSSNCISTEPRSHVVRARSYLPGIRISARTRAGTRPP